MNTIIRSDVATRQGLAISLRVFSVLAITASVGIVSGLLYVATVAFRMDEPVVCQPAGQVFAGAHHHDTAVDEKATQELEASNRLVSHEARTFTGFRRGTSSARAALLDAAENRKQEWLHLMTEDPSQARKTLLQPFQRAALAGVSRNCVEEKVTVSGTLTVMHGHEFRDHNADYTQYILETGQQAYTLHAEPSILAEVQVGSTIEVDGWRLDQELLVAAPSFPSAPSSGSDSPVEILSPPDPIIPPDPTTRHKLLVLMGNFNETNVHAPDPAGVEGIMTNVDEYYLENSYGQAGWEWETHDWTATGISRGTTCNVFAATNALIDAVDPVVDFTQYNNQNLAILAPWLQMWTETLDPSCRWGGMASVTPRSYQTDDGLVYLNTVWIKVPYTKQTDIEYVLNHELGHNLVGTFHADWHMCPAGQSFPTTSSACTSGAYEDPYDVMGGWYAPTQTVYHEGHFSGFRKNEAGWLAPGNIVTITDLDPGGTFTLEPVERPGAGLKMVRIKRTHDPYADDGYYSGHEYTTIEYRQPTFADGSLNMDNLFNTSSTPLPNVFQGALVRTAKKSQTFLLDSTPVGANSPATATLGVGQSLTDPKTGSIITVVSMTTNGLTVTVTPPVIDSWAPAMPEVVSDGSGTDVDTQASTTTLSANWPAVQDIGSGVASYQYTISSPSTTLFSGIDNGVSTSLNLTGLSLTIGETYYVEVRAVDRSENYSSYRISDGVTVTGPSPSPAPTPPGGSSLLPLGVVYDGPGHLPEADYTSNTSVLTAWWVDDNNPVSVASYQYAIGTTYGGANVVPFTDVGQNPAMNSWNLNLTSGTRYYVAVRIIGIDGKATAATVSNGITVDTVAPPAPASVFDGSTIGLDQDITASRTILAGNWSGVSDPSGVNYQYAIGRTAVAPNFLSFTDRQAFTSVVRNDLSINDGEQYFFFARAIDRAGNFGPVTVSDGITIDAASDPVAPTVSLSAPTAGATLSGAISLAATAADNIGVVGVQFQLDGLNIGLEDAESPYTLSWASGGTPNGSHTFRAVARDAAGNLTASSFVNITLNNAAIDTDPPFVVVLAPAANATVSGTTLLRATAFDNVGVQQVTFFVDNVQVGLPDTTNPYSINWDTHVVGNGVHTLVATATDGGGNMGTSPSVNFTVANAPADLLPPVVSMLSPVSNSAVNGLVQIEATATDDIGVVGVQFLLNNNPLGSEDTSSPYALTWNTGTVADGSYTLSARARDASAKTTTSAAISVTVQNVAPPPPPDVTRPTVTMIAPSSGARVSGKTTVSASAGDNVAVGSVQFSLDGRLLGNVTSAPYAMEWDTSTTTNGVHQISALATDTAGNVQLASTFFTVDNPVVTPPAPSPTPTPAPTPPPVTPTPKPVGGSTLTLVVPTTNRIVTGSRVPITAVTDISRIAEVLFFRDGVKIGSDKTLPYILNWDSRTTRNGSHKITVKVRSVTGTEWIEEISIRTKNKLQVNFAVPKPNAKVKKVIPLKPNIYGGEKIKSIEYFVDGKKLRTASKAQTSYAWNTRSVRTGLHYVKVIVTDVLKNKSSNIIPVVVRR